ncbi:hypothetical protein [Rossellomorea aquimaris]|uniref:hypothetical protein n=1 Tax=Rossellomorea aquimaris TaxID=189382 RepID=UPI0011E908F1|nr:hypothetical protein [Rossellomorea aquimaris]TYS83518.1 hypothetical protein FZC88_23430 [Rossellomorea aquimaris]
MELKNNSVIHFFSIYIEKFNGLEEEYIVGRKDTGEYINVPSVAVESIELLKSGMDIETVEKELSTKYNEEIGVYEFIKTCIEIGFIKKVDGREILHEEPKSPVTDQFSFIKQSFAKILFNPFSWVIYTALSIYSLCLFYVSPNSLPHIRDFLFHDSLSVVVTVGLLSMWGLIFIHEMGHLIAARAHGTESKVKFGRSGMYLVIETVIPNVWSVSRKGRNEIFLAGLAFNSVMLSLSLTFVTIHDLGILTMSEELYRFLRFVNIINVWSFITQPLIFTKSDLYYVLNNQWNCTDLHGNTALFTRQKFGFQISDEDRQKLEKISSHERIGINKYVPIYFIGLIFSACVAVAYVGFTFWYLKASMDTFTQFELTTLVFWDHFFGLGYLITPIIWLFVYLIQDFFKAKQRASFVTRSDQV